ncbi:hypothetical protein BSN85_11985 [Bradyrhizobium brasilense]|nr:hypothetical protein BSN85_11985 [Bradyrhizobium brasilense]
MNEKLFTSLAEAHVALGCYGLMTTLHDHTRGPDGRRHSSSLSPVTRRDLVLHYAEVPAPASFAPIRPGKSNRQGKLRIG